MAWTRRKITVVAGVVVLLGMVTVSLTSTVSEPGKLKLPVGRGIPSIGLGERHGLILASDGSLWSWGCDFLGWPVLGLGTSSARPGNRTTRLRRIGQENNWVSISAGESHNLAIKADGTLWTWGESVQARQSGLTAIGTPRPAAPGNDWMQAAAGGIHSMASPSNRTGHCGAGDAKRTFILASAIPLRMRCRSGLALIPIGGAFPPAPGGGARDWSKRTVRSG